MQRAIFASWVFVSIALLLYSFTQVDLSLTLSQLSVWQSIQKFFQYIGYFNRPLSTYLFLTIIFAMFFLYGYTLKMIKEGNLTRHTLWKIVIGLSVILFLSYNAFSYDLFNYIFDAKIVTHYHQSPYEHKALDYPGDPMLSFMHWTHRTLPYGLSWLLLTVPISFIGFGYFLLTFYLFKLLMVLSFVGSALLIEKISKKTGSNVLFSTAAFALNPLVLIESLVSAHNDIVMMFFALLAILTFIEKKYIKSFISLVFSIFIKYATVLIIPAIIVRQVLNSRKDIFFYVLTLSMIAAVLLATYRTNFQPWYLLSILTFSTFITNKYFILIPVFVISLFGLLQYVPFLYLGNWDPPVPMILNWIMIISIAVSIIIIAGWRVRQGIK